jgi:hypothetical protein
VARLPLVGRASIAGPLPCRWDVIRGTTGRKRLSSAWIVHKGHKTAECVVWSHVLGWELRLTAGAELLQSHVCSHEELVKLCRDLRDAMLAKGWEQHRAD